MINTAVTIQPMQGVQSEKRLYKRLKHGVGDAILKYNMIEDGDRITASDNRPMVAT